MSDILTKDAIVTPGQLAFEAYKKYFSIVTDPNASGPSCMVFWNKYQELCLDLPPGARLSVRERVQEWWVSNHSSQASQRQETSQLTEKTDKGEGP